MLNTTNREVAGKSIMVDDEGKPVLINLRMRPPEDGEAFGSEIEAVLGLPIEDPEALVEEMVASAPLDQLPPEMREMAEERLEEARESMLDQLTEDKLVALPCHACGAPVFVLGMN